MTRASRAFRTDRVFAAVVVVALVSLVLFLIVQLAARLATPWLSASASTAKGTLVEAVHRCGVRRSRCSRGRVWRKRRRATPRRVRTASPQRDVGAELDAEHAPIGVYAAEQLGWYRDAGIDLNIIEPTDAGAEQAVGAGRPQFGVSMAEGVLPARGEGIPIVSIGTILPVNDCALDVARRTRASPTPTDLAGKTYGGYNGPLETELIDRLAKCGGIDPVEREAHRGRQRRLPRRAARRTVSTSSGSSRAGTRCVPPKSSTRTIDLIRFDDHFDCIPNWYTPLFITSEKMIKKHPRVRQKFMDVTARGYQLAIDDPQRAADLMMKAVPEMDEELIRAPRPTTTRRFVANGEPFGTQDQATWSTFERSSSTPGCSRTGGRRRRRTRTSSCRSDRRRAGLAARDRRTPTAATVPVEAIADVRHRHRGRRAGRASSARADAASRRCCASLPA